jgi:hypothetical protein
MTSTTTEPVTTTSDDDDDIHDFLEDYARALTEGDGKGVASHWEVPALVVGADAVLAITDLDEVSRFFANARLQYAEQGVTDTRADVVDRKWIGRRIVEVETRWPWLDKAGDELGGERATYT